MKKILVERKELERRSGIFMGKQQYFEPVPCLWLSLARLPQG